MDLILLVGIALSLLVVLITIYLFQKKSPQKEKENVQVQRALPVRPQDGMRRRAEIARNQRNRLRNAAARESSDSDDDGNNEGENVPVVDEKMGAKKRAKLEAKAEKRAHREAEMHSREDKKKKEALAEVEKKQLEEKIEQEEQKKEEVERLEREKKEREEHEEYLKMKAAFSIEEEGFEEGDDNEKETLLLEFIQYIKNNKVVVLEDLATQFKLKTQQAIERITELQKNNSLTGVIDDRGKFIYISEDELKSVAKFIRQRGRISIADLAESSNNLINLTPVTS